MENFHIFMSSVHFPLDTASDGWYNRDKPENEVTRMDNICRFPKTGNLSDGLSILNFVFERTADFPPKYLTPANYAMNVVVSGSGVLHTPCGDYPVSEDNVFLTFSAKPYFIENAGNLGYIYVSFIGPRAERLMKRAGFTADSPVLACPEKLTERWKEDFGAADDSCIDLVAESLLLYTISLFCRDATERHDGGFENGILKIKQFVDLNYASPDLDLTSVSARFGYSPKYVSAAFVRLVRENFSDYLRDLRLSHARKLLDGGMYNVREVSSACGFSDALYFSKVFRKNFGVSPREYMKRKAI